MVEVLKGLTPRLADSQSNLKPLAASAIAEVAASVGTDSATKVHAHALDVTNRWVCLCVICCTLSMIDSKLQASVTGCEVHIV